MPLILFSDATHLTNFSGDKKAWPIYMTIGNLSAVARGTSSLHELGSDLLQVRVLPGSRLHGVYLNELRLPPGATAGLVSRDGCTFAVAPETRLQTNDVLLVFTDPRQRQATEQRILAVHRSGRLASWLGDTGG